MQHFRRFIFRYLKPYKSLIAANMFSNMLMALFTVVSIPALIPFFQVLFDNAPQISIEPELTFSIQGVLNYGQYQFSQLIAAKGREGALTYACAIIVVLFFLKNLFRYLSLFFMSPIRNGIVRDIRQEVFAKLLNMPLSYYSEERKGDLLSRVTSDVQEIEWSILNTLEAIIRAPLIIIGCLIVMIYLSPSLMIFVFGLLLFTVLIIGGIGKTLKKQSTIAQSKLGSLVTMVEEALSGLRIIKGFNAESFQEEKFKQTNQDYRNVLMRLYWRRDLSSPLSEFLGIVVVTILLWFGSKQVFSEQLSVETFFAFLYAFFNVIEPAKSFSSAFFNIQKGMAAVERIEEVLNVKNSIVEIENAKPINRFESLVEYRNVGFTYTESEGAVLKNINVKIPQGKVIALVGISGAGKSTFVDLLPRFYDVAQGAIFIDGVNIKEYKIDQLRRLMGIVSQEPILFNDSIYNNIVFGMEGVNQKMVEEAARIANAHEFIMATENGYKTVIGDRGNKLSGGQRQRLTIARAILKNPPILILDEATSSLDSESERLVQEALLHLMQNRTAIVIAHRLSTIQHADEIIVMEEGEIIERGTHEELLKSNGAYRKLVALQAF